MWLPLNLGKRGSLGLSIIDRKNGSYYCDGKIKHRFSVAVMEATVDYRYSCFSDSIDFIDEMSIEHQIVHAMTGIVVEGDNLNDCIEECKKQIISEKL